MRPGGTVGRDGCNLAAVRQAIGKWVGATSETRYPSPNSEEGSALGLEVRLLGDVAVVVDGRPVALGGVLTRSLIALLVLNRNHPIGTETLIDRLWPDEPPLTATKTVQVYVSRIRRLLGSEADRLASAASGYSLRVADEELDTARFERLVRDGRQPDDAASRPAAVAALEAAIALWRGPALADLGAEPFARHEAERLEELRIQALEELVELHLAIGTARHLIGDLRAAAREHPSRERLWRQLMLALYADGRQAEALAAYHEARRYLDDALGIDPGNSLQLLERRILDQDQSLPSERAPQVHVVAGSPNEPVSPRSSDPPAQPRPRGRRTVTVLAISLTGGAEVAGNLDPEAFDAILDRLASATRAAVERHGGELVQIEAETMLAVFGLSMLHEDDPIRAARAALETQQRLRDLDDETRERWGLGLRAGFGLHTGEVVTRGQVPTGAVVETAVRLAQAAGGAIILSAVTNRLVRNAAETTEADAGSNKTDATYALVSVRSTDDRGGRPLTPFVGRSRELERLEQSFRATLEERSCQLFTLLGSAGVGKSRLVAEFVGTLEPDVAVVRGRCLSYGEGVTYWPIAEILRGASGIDETDSADSARAKLRASLDGLRDADLLAARVASGIGLSTDVAPKEELFWAIRRVLEHLAGDGPIVVVIEDIHWAEPTLLDLIEHIAERSRGAPILILCPARPELLEIRTGWGGGLVNATTALLEPLGIEATNRIIATLPGGQALPAAVQSRILEAAEGNPLYVEEILGMLVDEGLVVRAPDGSWRATSTLAEIRVPLSISAVLAARLDRLAPNERAVAERASVVGRVFEQEAVTELADQALRPEVNACLLALVRKELVRPDRSDLSSGDAYRFRHVLIRDAAYAAMSKAERAELHGRFATWLERAAGERLAEYEEIVGHHLESAYHYRMELGETGVHLEALASQAASRLASAGDRAFQRGDMPAAEALLSRAQGLLPAGSMSRLSLMPDVGFALFATGRIRDAELVLRAAIDEAIHAGRRIQAIHAELELGLVRILSSGEHRASRMIAEGSIAELESLNDHLGLARAYLVIACANWINGRVEAAIVARERALEHGARAGEHRTERWNAFWGAECYGPEPATRAIRRLEQTLADSEGDPLLRAQALFSLAGLYAMRGRLDDARAACAEVRTILEELGTRVWSMTAPAEIGGVTELILGDPAKAEAWLKMGIGRLKGVGASGYESTLEAIQAVAAARQGKAEEALSCAERAIDGGSTEDILLHVAAQTGLAIALRLLGNAPAAVEAGRTAVGLVESTDWVSYHADAMLALAEALETNHERREAVRAATRARELYVAKESVMGEQRAASFLELLGPSAAGA